MPCVDPLSLLPAIRRSAWRLHARLPASVDHDDLVQAGMLRVLERQQRTQDDAAAYLLTVAWGGMLDFLRAGDPLHHTERLRVRRLAEARDRVERRVALLHRRRGRVGRYQRLDARWRAIVDDWLAERPQVETAAALGVTPGRVTQIRQQAVERIVG